MIIDRVIVHRVAIDVHPPGRVYLVVDDVLRVLTPDQADAVATGLRDAADEARLRFAAADPVERMPLKTLRVLNHRRRRGENHRCEVIACGRAGPHQCEQRAGFLVDGRYVCRHHAIEAPHVAVFTEGDAMTLRRERSRNHGDAAVRERGCGGGDG